MLLLVLLLPASASSDAPVILLIADYVTLSDLKDANLPNINRLLNESSIGLISPSAMGRKTTESVYATLGAGVQLRGAGGIGEGFNVNEEVRSEEDTAAIVYGRRMGQAPPREGLVNLGFGQLLEANRQYGKDDTVGQLGKAFREAGKTIAVYGNSDIGKQQIRPAVVFAADEAGRVPAGDVGSANLLPKWASASGFVTNINYLAEAAEKEVGRSSLIILDFGDTTRLYLSKPELDQQAYTMYNRETFKQLDTLVGRLMKLSDRYSGLLITASFIPPEQEERPWTRLTPIMIYGRGKGLITSATTRRAGVIAGVDIAPGLLDAVGIDIPDSMVGRRIMYKNSSNPLTLLYDIDRRSSLATSLQWVLLSAAAVFGGLIVTSAAATAAFKRGTAGCLGSAALRAGLTAAAALYGALMINSLGGISAAGQIRSVIAAVPVLCAGGYICAALAGRWVGKDVLARKALPLIGVMLITAAVITADVLTGARLISSSVASYQLTAGFRYYGIGNEYMGVLLGTLFTPVLWLSVSSGCVEPKSISKAVVVIVFSTAVVLLGWPGLGANAGGAIAAIIMFGLGYRAVSKGIFRVSEALGLIILSFGLLVLFAFIDYHTGHGVSSHMGLTVGSVEKSGWMDIFQVTIRKLSMNLNLMGTKQSRTTIITFIPFFAMWIFGIRPAIGRLIERYPRLRPGLLAGVSGASAAFIFNDSGVVSSAIILSTLVLALLYTLLQEEASGAANNGS